MVSSELSQYHLKISVNDLTVNEESGREVIGRLYHTIVKQADKHAVTVYACIFVKYVDKIILFG